MFRQLLFLCCLSIISLISCKTEPSPIIQTATPAAIASATITPRIMVVATSTSVVDSQTAPQPSLSGVIQNQIEPGFIHPSKPLRIEFDQKLMKSSTADPLRFDPPVAGSFHWYGASIMFSPDNGFASGETYQITQSPQLLSKSGRPFGEPLVWEIQTLSELFSSDSKTQQKEAITDDEWLITFPIDFSRKVDWQSVEEQIIVEPSVPVKVSWWEDGRLHQKDIPDNAGRVIDKANESFPEANQMLVQMRVPFDLEQTYRFLLQESVTGCHSCEAVWVDAFEKKVELPPLSAKVIQTDLFPQFQFNYRLDLDNLTAIVALDPVFEAEWHAEWNESGTLLTMKSNKLLPNEILYTLGLNGSTYDENGILLSGPSGIVRFETPFAIEKAYPGREYWIGFSPLSNIEITFTHKMDETSVNEAFQIEPHILGSLSWEGNRLSFQPESGHLDAFSQYTVTLGASARDNEGRLILPEPYEWQFGTLELPTDADFGVGIDPAVQMIDTNGSRIIQYRSYPQEPIRVDFELYALIEEGVLQFLQGESKNGKRTVTSQWTAVTEPKDVDNFRLIGMQETHLPADVPAGPYLLTLNTGTSYDELLVLISENTVVVKRSKSQISVWATKINGENAGGLDVTVVDENGAFITGGVSSHEGFYQTALEDNRQPAFVLVQDDEDLAIVILDREWPEIIDSGLGTHCFAPCALTTVAHIYTDRPLYRPNETVFFKAVLRNDDDAEMTPLPTKAPVTVTLKTLDWEVLQILNLETNDFGSIHGQFQLPDTLVSDDYRIEIVTENGYTQLQTIKVDAHQSATDYKVSVSTDAESYKKDETIFVTAQSTYLTGEPVANAKIEINLRSPNWSQSSSFAGRWDQWGEATETITGTTDINGRFTVQFEPSAPTSDEPIIDVLVDNGSGRVATRHTQIHYDAVSELHQLDIGDYHKKLGSTVIGSGAVYDSSHEPITELDVHLEIRQDDVDSPEGAITVHASTEQTNSNGEYIFEFTPTEVGYYGFTAWVISDSGYSAIASGSFMIYDEDSADMSLLAYPDNDELDFSHADAYYNIMYVDEGSAKLFIQSTVVGPALLTIGRKEVRSQQIINLTPPITIVDIPIPDNSAPNLFATVMTWQKNEPPGHMYESLSIPEYELLASTVNLSLPKTHQLLNVEVSPQKEAYQAGEEAQVTLRVTDFKGDPVSAELSLSMVDEAIFQLIPDFSEAIEDVFYFNRRGQTMTDDSMNSERRLWYKVNEMPLGDYSGMNYYGLFKNYQNAFRSEDRARSLNGPHGDFLGTAAWYPVLHTDANGEVTVSFTLPDKQANWQINVRAITKDTQVGEAVYTVNTD